MGLSEGLMRGKPREMSRFWWPHATPLSAVFSTVGLWMWLISEPQPNCETLRPRSQERALGTNENSTIFCKTLVLFFFLRFRVF